MKRLVMNRLSKFRPGRRALVRVALPVLILAIASAANTAWSATGTTTITMSTGNSISITITPTTETLSEDVVSPGANWAYQDPAASWFPGGVANGFVYTPGGSAGCTKAVVRTFKSSWSLSASVTLSPVTAPLAVYLADATSSCTTPSGTAVAIGTTPTTLASGLSNSQTKQYYLLLAPTGGSAIASTTTITITYTAQ